MGEFEYEGSISSTINVELPSCDTGTHIINKKTKVIALNLAPTHLLM